MSDQRHSPNADDESDAKGATEEDTQKIGVIDPDDPLGNERATEEHSGQDGDREEE